MRKASGAALALAALLTFTLVPAAPASVFCGGNGVVKLAFTPDGDLDPVLRAAPDSTGLTVVEVWAVLDEVAEVEGPQGVFLHLGGFELELAIRGAEGRIIAAEVPFGHNDFAASPAALRVGVYEAQRLEDGRLPLVRWEVMFTGAVQDVVFELAPSGMPSCPGIPGCGEAGCHALYIGSRDANQTDHVFGAGHRPAALNPTGEVVLEPVPCAVSWRDVGVYGERIRHERD